MAIRKQAGCSRAPSAPARLDALPPAPRPSPRSLIGPPVHDAPKARPPSPLFFSSPAVHPAGQLSGATLNPAAPRRASPPSTQPDAERADEHKGTELRRVSQRSGPRQRKIPRTAARPAPPSPPTHPPHRTHPPTLPTPYPPLPTLPTLSVRIRAQLDLEKDVLLQAQEAAEQLRMEQQAAADEEAAKSQADRGNKQLVPSPPPAPPPLFPHLLPSARRAPAPVRLGSAL